MVVPSSGYGASYVNERGYPAVTIYVYWPRKLPEYRDSGVDLGGSIREVRIIDGHPAVVRYAPKGRSQRLTTEVWIFDVASSIQYIVVGLDSNLSGNIDVTIGIARSLLRPVAPR